MEKRGPWGQPGWVGDGGRGTCRSQAMMMFDASNEGCGAVVSVDHGAAELPQDVGPRSTATDDVLADGGVGEVLAMAGGWLGEAERALATGDHEGAAGSLAYAVEALDALTVDADDGTPQPGIATRLLACYRALVAAGKVELPAAPAFAATG